MTFPVGYYSLHPDASMNFQMNRWFGWVGEEGMLDEMRSAAPRIANYCDWKREFLALAENATGEGHILRAGFYFRAAYEVVAFEGPGQGGALNDAGLHMTPEWHEP